ncbi:MAG: hypothetical protein IJP01_05760 [Oscillospiraceae bacterium]|nr:hypothetical protein [Oscillospiraceae bacterium]
MENKGKVKAVASALALLLGMVLGGIFGAARLGVSCPLRTAAAIVRVVAFEKPTHLARRAPRVVVARSADAMEALISYQALRGFTHLPDEQMGSLLTFSNGSAREQVSVSVNRYYSIWEWQE